MPLPRSESFCGGKCSLIVFLTLVEHSTDLLRFINCSQKEEEERGLFSARRAAPAMFFQGRGKKGRKGKVRAAAAKGLIVDRVPRGRRGTKNHVALAF